ncbi:MAG: SDR family oxidoreductase [Elusimicrobia bacterium]|nr:SDR family oxidoreductase [Elusimicrobiota bacterium]
MALALAGKKAVVTGAAGGLGRALVFELLQEGAKVLAVDKNEKGLAALAREAEGRAFSLATLQADVSAKESYLTTLTSSCGEKDPPQLFINNAGLARIEALEKMDLAHFEEIMRVNLLGTVYGSHFALSRMKPAGEGLIVNVSSMAGHIPAGFMTAYAASKFGVVGFTRALQAELRLSRSPVRACLVSPGFFDTPLMRQKNAPFPKFLEWMVARPEAVAARIVNGIKKGKAEIYPDLSAKIMRNLHRVSPALALRASRLLAARSLAEALGLTPISF